ncbi:MAG: hypothetical protein GY898_27580 [Proteobacteria bacterium]|nr:hypothetical protein [Pseudomonadota bacterium]
MIAIARPGARLVVDSVVGTVLFGAVAAALVTALSTAERGAQDAIAAVEVLTLIGPLAAAAAVAAAVARSRSGGRWDGWSGLGVSPRQQLAPLVLVALLGAGAQLSVPPPRDVSTTLAAIAAPAPVDPAAHWWPDGSGGWDEPALARWKVRSAALTTAELVARSNATAPRGARVGVDRGELVRRAGLVLGWPAAVLLGVGAALTASRRRRDGRDSVIRAAALACAGAALWLIAVLSAAAYASVGM